MKRVHQLYEFMLTVQNLAADFTKTITDQNIPPKTMFSHFATHILEQKDIQINSDRYPDDPSILLFYKDWTINAIIAQHQKILVPDDPDNYYTLAIKNNKIILESALHKTQIVLKDQTTDFLIHLFFKGEIPTI